MKILFVLGTFSLLALATARYTGDPTLIRGDQLYPATHRKVRRHDNEDGSVTYEMLLITDMDKDAKTEEWKWRAVVRKGYLTLSEDKQKIKIEWAKEPDQNLTTSLNYKGRAMELSDLTEYNGHLVTPDDKTGMLYQIIGKKAIPWIFLNSGPGNTTNGMKVEWLTIKDDLLYAGGHGTEYRNTAGDIVSEDPMWIKTITETGEVESSNWKEVYNTIRNTAGYPSPGYLTHEAVQWSEARQMWYFLPRKASKTIYKEKEDETKGTNLLIMGPPDLESFDVVYIGKREVEHPDRGYSAFDFIPDTDDEIILALKSKEVEGSEPESYITAFNVHGKVLMEDQRLDGNYKFEALYFV